MSERAGTIADDAARATLREHANDLLSYLQRRVHAREDAADLLGETLLQAWKRIDSMPVEPERQRMWLFTIAAKVLANFHRSKVRRLALSDRLRDHLTRSGSTPDHSDAHAIRDAVLRLQAAHRELVMLVHWDGFTILEAAQLLDVNPSTARSRYAAAKAALRDALAEEVCS
ncbi:RNA polymerase sigma factor [Nocardioides sp. BP30]|uniref:RNA polymerase sigma factor n=1 Tax=Nocardioides sp. BP30 TaxID=3036374 RepID=UPI0024695F66|nr:RNA polymerase sigma factor [Nocardioides sp. BP30]WGL53519.1 RNA polymerase sigma factor [Nocardioides sp. BP30]